MKSASFYISNYQINDAGDIAFNATLDTANSDGFPDHGLYVWSHGALRLVARTGTVVPGIGTIKTLTTPTYVEWYGDIAFSWVGFNNLGEVLFQATLTDGRVVLLKAAAR